MKTIKSLFKEQCRLLKKKKKRRRCRLLNCSVFCFFLRIQMRRSINFFKGGKVVRAVCLFVFLARFTANNENALYCVENKRYKETAPSARVHRCLSSHA